MEKVDTDLNNNTNNNQIQNSDDEYSEGSQMAVDDTGVVSSNKNFKNKRIEQGLDWQNDVRSRTDHRYNDDITKGEGEDGDDVNREKIRVPKRKFCVIHGYLGHRFCGNQK